jgi:hypothetical protein
MKAAMSSGSVGKPFAELKAEPMSARQLDRWLSGEIPRRLLAVPFGGPIPSSHTSLGVDLDGEFFSPNTDLFDGHKALLSTRDRLVDWHHVTSSARSVDPVGGRMKGAILGRIVMDESPEADGLWVDFWANAGEKRLALMKQLEERHVPLFGSSYAPYKKADAITGEILTWPMTWETISTSPQNTRAVLPSFKAMLDSDIPLDEVDLAALRAAVVGLEALAPDLSSTWATGEMTAKAGRVLSAVNEAELRRAMEALNAVLAKLAKDEDIIEALAIA